MSSSANVERKRTCPLCATTLDKHTGVIEEAVMTVDGRIERRARPGVFYACNVCEHCEEKSTIH